MSRTTASTSPRRWLSPALLLWLALGFMTIWVIGAHVDAWYHVHHGFEIESFFTWTHALLYGGAAGTGVVVALYLVEGIWRRVPRREWLPQGFWLVLAGVILFGVGGPADALWHEAFGFEVDLEAVLSPTHLWLVVAVMLALFGLLCASVDYRPPLRRFTWLLRWRDLPLVLSIAFLFRMVLWNLGYSEPFNIDYPASDPIAADLPALQMIDRETATAEIAGITGIFIHSLLLALFLVVPLRYLFLPAGAITIILVTNAVLEMAVNDMWWYVPAAIGGALVGEVLWTAVRRGWLGGMTERIGYWTLAFVVPFSMFVLYLGLTWLNGGILWSTHLWMGTPIIAGLYGLIASLLAIPPRFLQFAARLEEQPEVKLAIPEAVEQQNAKPHVRERV